MHKNQTPWADGLLVLLHHVVSPDLRVAGMIADVCSSIHTGRTRQIVIANGHEHDQVGVQRHKYKNADIAWAGLGCLGRLSRAEANLIPHLTSVVLKPDVFKVTQSALDCPLGDDAFTPTSTLEQDKGEDDVQVAEFIATLRGAGAAESVDPIAIVREQGARLKVSAPVLERAVRLVRDES